MASAREHIASNHQTESAHWAEFAKGLAESGLQKLAATAQGHADYHAGAAEECMKAIEPLPRGFSRVAPTAPVAVPRFGAKALGKAAVDEEFADLVRIQDEE